MPPQNQPPEPPPTRSYPIPSQGQTVPQPQVQPQAQAQAQPQDPSRMSRRSLLRGGLAGGGIGLAVAAGAGVAVGMTRDSSKTSLKPASKPVVMAPMEAHAVQGPLVMYISDAGNGVIDVFGGTGATRIHNPALVTQLLDNLK